MGERPDEVRDYGRTTPQSEGGSGSAGSRAAGSERARSGDEVQRTRAEIERTREDMSETIDAIQEKGSPQNLKEQVKEQARGRAKGMGSTIMDTIKENPLPAALAGIGLGWLFVSGRKQSSGQHRHQEGVSYAHQYPPSYEPARHEQRGSSGSSESQALSRAESKAGQAASQAQHQAQRAKGTLERMLHENPLAVGALAVGAGAAVGLAVPETSKENQLMGETRDSLAHEAQQKAQEIKPKVERVAKEAQSAAKDEARDQGLTQQ